MDAAAWTAIGGIAVAIVTAVVSPLIVSQVKQREERDPTSGWQAAFTYMKRRLDELDVEVKSLRSEVDRLEGDNDAKNQVITRQEAVITEQSRAIVARDHRIAQLESAWPNSTTLPRPDPAFESLLR